MDGEGLFSRVSDERAGVDVLCCANDGDCFPSKPFCNLRDKPSRCASPSKSSGRCTAVTEESPLTFAPFIPPLREVPMFYVGVAFFVSSAVSRMFGRFSASNLP